VDDQHVGVGPVGDLGEVFQLADGAFDDGGVGAVEDDELVGVEEGPQAAVRGEGAAIAEGLDDVAAVRQQGGDVAGLGVGAEREDAAADAEGADAAGVAEAEGRGECGRGATSRRRSRCGRRSAVRRRRSRGRVGAWVVL
jgi:hypothetical protein